MTAPRPTVSVLIPSFRRPETLRRCLDALTRQTVAPDEVLVVWQGDDAATRDAAENFSDALPVRALHRPEPGIVPAENAALAAATGEVIALIDDDALAPPDWLAKHLAFYADPSVGAVGGPAVNHADGTTLPTRAVEPVGRLTAAGRLHGNMYDHPATWRERPPTDVDHLVGYNMSLRRAAFDRFEERLRPYWQLFELDACLQVAANGYRVVFDYSNVVDHHPTNTAYVGGRGGDLTVKVYNGAYNRAFVLSKHTRGWRRGVRRAWTGLVGSTAAPGALAALRCAARDLAPRREWRILRHTWRAAAEGWAAGRAAGSFDSPASPRTVRPPS
ncbi:glycosyltransferase family 2 protein [Alienimonas sp. DA493]|uniref:glycosyltransferase family 2 protein n=1 Tax=Alienimonas sp. DA493 TaxID=3373605 RepID=UPI0037543F2F